MKCVLLFMWILFSLAQCSNAVRKACTQSNDCPISEACVRSKCRRLCPDYCGIDALCTVSNHVPVCNCPPGLQGDPFDRCTRIGETALGEDYSRRNSSNVSAESCTANADCGRRLACFASKCIDPCVNACGINALCKVLYHVPICNCPEGYVGNALSRCDPPNHELRRTTAQPIPREEGCSLPPKPTNGFYNVSGDMPVHQLNSLVPIGSYVTFNCEKGYALEVNGTGIASIYCTGEGWIPKGTLPKCLAMCPPLISKSVHIRCKLGEAAQDCSKPVLHRTKALLSCNTLYEHVAVPSFRSVRCWDGFWDYPLEHYRCKPVCGKKSNREAAKPLIIKGRDTRHGEHPWQVGIYDKEGQNELICSGALLNDRAVLSAAHCFTYQSNGQTYSKEKYALAAGKFFRQLRHVNDRGDEQIRNVKELHVPSTYKGILRNYDDDIAIVVADKQFILTEFVQPVCIDWSNTITENRMTFGVVSGWGLTEEEGQSSDTLKELSVPYVKFDECFKSVPDNFKPFLSSNKICAGYSNGSSVCNGDSGGALTFEYLGKYYVKGIVSVAPGRGNHCDSHHYSTYTNVDRYLDWIEEREADNGV